MKADWRSLAFFGAHWMIVIISAAVSVYCINLEGALHWSYFALFGIAGIILIFMALISTAALIYEIRENSALKKAARQEEIKARLKELEKYDENKLLEVLAEFGYQDQFSALIKATQDGQLCWVADWEFDDDDDDVDDEAGATSFATILHKNYTPEEIKNGSVRGIVIEIWIKKMLGIYSLNFRGPAGWLYDVISYQYSDATAQGDKRVKELFDCVMQKCEKPQ